MKPVAGVIRRLMLHDVRNYAALDLSVDGKIVVLTGENGSGKTNLLEAISLLGPGRGLRGADRGDLVRQGASRFAVVADIEGALGVARLSTGGEPAEATRLCRVDREPVASASAFAEHLRIVWLTPDLDGLFRGAAGDRRRFLDRLARTLDPGHGTRAAAYEKALRGRNRLLETGADARWLDALEREAAELGVALAAGRRDLVAHLARLVAGADEGAFPRAALGLSGDLERRLADGPAASVEDWFRQALRDARPRDAAAGRALIGPQASDFLVTHAPSGQPAALASTGQQKALLIAITLAHARLVAEQASIVPTVLLDEIAAHLDAPRRKALFDELDRLGAQVWMTGTDRALFDALPGGALRLTVAAAQVTGE